MLVVLDANVLFAGLISPHGASYQILSLRDWRRIDLCSNACALAEYEEQLHSERFLELTPLSLKQINDF